MAPTVLPPGEPDDALRIELLEQLLADRAVEDAVDMRRILEQEGQVENADLGHERAEGAGRDDGHVDRADLQAFDRLALLAELPVGVELDLEGPAAPLLHQFLEPLERDEARMDGLRSERRLDRRLRRGRQWPKTGGQGGDRQY